MLYAIKSNGCFFKQPFDLKTFHEIIYVILVLIKIKVVINTKTKPISTHNILILKYKIPHFVQKNNHLLTIKI